MVLLEKVPAGYENINTVTESFNFMSDIIVERNIFDSEIAEIFNEADDNRQKKTVMDRIKDFLLSFKKWIMGVIKKISEFFKKILFKHKKDADELNKKSKSLKDEIKDIIKDIKDEHNKAKEEILNEEIEIKYVNSLLDYRRVYELYTFLATFNLEYIYSKKNNNKEKINQLFYNVEDKIIDAVKLSFDYNEKISFNNLPDFNELKNSYLKNNAKVSSHNCNDIFNKVGFIEKYMTKTENCIDMEDRIRNKSLNWLGDILKDVDKELKKIEINKSPLDGYDSEKISYLKKFGQYVSKVIEIENYKIQLNRYIVEMNLNSIKKYNAFVKAQLEKLKKYTNNDDEVTNESTNLTDNLSIVETHSKFIAECAYNDIIFENVLLEKDYAIDNKSNFKEKAINFFKGIKEFLKKYALKFKNYILSFIHKLKIAKYTGAVTPNNKDLLAEFSRKEENIYKVTSYKYDIDSLFSYGSKNDKLLCGWFDELNMNRNLEEFLIIGSNVEKLDYEEKTNIILSDLISYFSNLERGDSRMFSNFIKNKKGNFGKANSFNSFIDALKDFLNLPAHEKIDNSKTPTDIQVIPYIEFCNDKDIKTLKTGILEGKIKMLIQMLNNTTSQLGKLEMMISKAEKEYLSKAIDLDTNISSNINSNIKYAFSIIGKLTQINTMISTTMTKQYYGEKVELEKMIAWKNRKDEEFIKFCEDKKKYKDKEDTK